MIVVGPFQLKESSLLYLEKMKFPCEVACRSVDSGGASELRVWDAQSIMEGRARKGMEVCF